MSQFIVKLFGVVGLAIVAACTVGAVGTVISKATS